MIHYDPLLIDRDALVVWCAYDNGVAEWGGEPSPVDALLL